MANGLVVTRFAPSPTGYLHVGGARTALFNWLLARHASGRYLLRIEDTDLARSTEESVQAVLQDLRWLGLDHDNAELVFQSKRLAVYNAVITDLMNRGLAYEAWETPEELAAMRQQAEKAKQAFIYRRREYTADELKRFRDEGRTPTIRFAMPVREYRFHDQVLGKEIVVALDQVQDFVIRKTDGMPTYHFAVVVDDAEMGITHILRGQEHLLNTVNHIALQEAINAPRPVYGHLPVILNADGSKMGKRDRDKKVRESAQVWMKTHKKTAGDLSAESGIAEERLSTWLNDKKQQLDLTEQKAVMAVIGLRESDLPEILVHDFRKNGYLPEALINFLALLGWNPGGDRERMSIDTLIELFSLEGIGHSNARFDRAKLLSFNTDACATADSRRLVQAMRDYLAVNPESPVNQATDEQLGQLLEMKKGFRTLREVDEVSRFLFVADDQIAFDDKAVAKVLVQQKGTQMLRELRPILEGLATWSAEAIEQAIQQFCDAKKLGLGKVAQPLRVAISGTTVSPPIFQSLAFLTREQVLARIDRCLLHVDEGPH